VVHLSGQCAFSNEAYPYRDLTGWHEALEYYSAKGLMWDADFSWILKGPGYGSFTAVIKELLPYLSEYEYNDIMGGNASRFLRFPIR